MSKDKAMYLRKRYYDLKKRAGKPIGNVITKDGDIVKADDPRAYPLRRRKAKHGDY